MPPGRSSPRDEGWKSRLRMKEEEIGRLKRELEEQKERTMASHKEILDLRTRNENLQKELDKAKERGRKEEMDEQPSSESPESTSKSRKAMTRRLQELASSKAKLEQDLSEARARQAACMAAAEEELRRLRFQMRTTREKLLAAECASQHVLQHERDVERDRVIESMDVLRCIMQA